MGGELVRSTVKPEGVTGGRVPGASGVCSLLVDAVSRLGDTPRTPVARAAHAALLGNAVCADRSMWASTLTLLSRI